VNAALFRKLHSGPIDIATAEDETKKAPG